ncbi:hypothetical protein HanXRQr2_Chr05g0194401 [Helianthus annuus]|uniref:Uncharacterized protein n=1 Tax=Helianthus annuus TaxID=4232 RepID=A0A251UM15_HELAN|nr:uncharacterized protein LOC110939729 [Helianthus annuus]KAF5804203.1 hypothetical protein HanXRQr2_Chr05g0194401 [Helianthus annuus]
MSLLSTLVACCGSSTTPTPTPTSSVSRTDSSTLIVGLVRENRVGGSDTMGRRSGRQAVQWRPSLCTISEEDVIKTEMIQLYVMPCNKGKKSTRMSRHNFKPYEHKKEFVLRDSWNMVSPVPSSFLF